MSAFEPWSAERGGAIVAEHQGLEGPLLPILHAMQETFGHVPEEATALIALALNLSRAEVHGVISFYHDFKREVRPAHELKIRRAEACQSMGGEAVAGETLRRLGLDWHGRTPDGALGVEPVYCLGLCANAPAAMLDGKPIARATPDRLTRLAGEARAR